MIKFEKQQRILMFFAHPDDETLAAGGTIKKLSEIGAEIFVAIPATGIFARRDRMTSGEMNAAFRQLRENCHSALEILGVPKDHLFLGEFPDNEMDRESLLTCIHWIESIVSEVCPSVVFTHHRYCTNIDHRICFEAAVVATRPTPDKQINLICSEVPSSTGYLRPSRWEPNLYVELNQSQLAAKLNAMEVYEGEIRDFPHPRSRENLKALATIRGSEAGFFYAESFLCLRCFA